ncbi:hypothetical protein HPP92_005913 [Vanilla planifolia]|uniref:Uncharacterized protein n=1 Tax=Vanilla planifolia TaxID=51239 RepID=A0A835RHP8_VANPL|nr:hypothetical protein HPP92_005913 [Vanilla planifolia]
MSKQESYAYLLQKLLLPNLAFEVAADVSPEKWVFFLWRSTISLKPKTLLSFPAFSQSLVGDGHAAAEAAEDRPCKQEELEEFQHGPFPIEQLQFSLLV